MKIKLYFLFMGLIIAAQLPAQAYLDPGTGSMVLQILIAVFAGIACWVKVQWHNIKLFFNNLSNKNKIKKDVVSQNIETSGVSEQSPEKEEVKL